MAVALSVLYTLAVFAWFAFAVETYTGIPAVVALVLQALVRIARRALQSSLHAVLAVASFVALEFARVPFPAVLLLAAVATGMEEEIAARARVAVRRDIGAPVVSGVYGGCGIMTREI